MATNQYGAPPPPPPTTAYGNAPATSNPNPYLNFMQSPGGSSIISAILGGISQHAQSQQQAQQNQQQMQMSDKQFGMNDQLQRDQSVLGASPTGWAQNYEQNTLLKNLMLQRMMQPATLPTDPRIAALVHPAPALQIPDEWKTVNPFGVDQTMSALATRQGNLDQMSHGQGPSLDFTQFGLDPTKAAQYNTQVGAYRKTLPNNPLQQAINQPVGGGTAPGMPEGVRPGVNNNGSKYGGAAGAAIGSFGGPLGSLAGSFVGSAIGGMTDNPYESMGNGDLVNLFQQSNQKHDNRQLRESGIELGKRVKAGTWSDPTSKGGK